MHMYIKFLQSNQYKYSEDFKKYGDNESHL